MDSLVSTFSEVVSKLESAKIPYMVVGSIAAMVYGEPRMTHDLDLVIQLSPVDAVKLETLFPSNEYYCPPIEVMTPEITRRGQFNLIHHHTGLKIDLVICKASEHARTEFARRKKMPLWHDEEVFVAAPEDVILKKLEYFREGASQKHVTDIRGVLAQTAVDLLYIEKWVGALGLTREWAEASRA